MQKHLIGCILTGLCSQAFADNVCFYTDKHYKGTKWCTSSNHSQVPHNDKYSSIEVKGTSLYAIVYHDGGYKGTHVAVMHNAKELKRLNDDISSVKIVRHTSEKFACLYQDANLIGTPFCVEANQGATSLDSGKLNDEVSSAYLTPDTSVQLFKDSNYRGDNITLYDSEANLKNANFNDITSSFKVAELMAPKEVTDGVCFYNEKDFKGRAYCFDNGTQLATVPSSQWSAIRVIGNGAVRIYKSSHYGGDQRNVMASAFQLHGMNDAIRSIKVYARNTRSFACMYDHNGFRGDVHCLAAGQVESNLKNIGYNDATSSMYVSGDVNVRLYKDANFSGSNTTLYKSTSDFHSRPGGWLDDDISSWKVAPGQKSDQEISIYLQEKLGQDARINHTTIMGSHNSTNSSAYNNTEGVLSPNQRRSIHEQLDMGVRFFEFDTHDEKDDDIALCHSFDCELGLIQSMKRISTEISDWLYNNPESFVFMYLNDYAANEKKLLIKEILQDTFGSLLHRPNGCQDMTSSLNQKTLLNQGKQIVVWTDSGCVHDAAFDQDSFWSSHDVRNQGKTFEPDQFINSKFSRAYECDHPTCTDVLNESQAHAGLLAGLNSIAQDQLVEEGKSLYHLWGLDYNKPWQTLFYGDSALAFNKTGWFRLSLVAQSTKLYPICKASDRWVLGARQATFTQAPSACRDAGANFDYPTYIIEAEAVRDVLEANNIHQVYINFGKQGDKWGAL